jgi:hypothetical protein
MKRKNKKPRKNSREERNLAKIYREVSNRKERGKIGVSSVNTSKI